MQTLEVIKMDRGRRERERERESKHAHMATQLWGLPWYNIKIQQRNLNMRLKLDLAICGGGLLCEFVPREASPLMRKDDTRGGPHQVLSG